MYFDKRGDLDFFDSLTTIRNHRILGIPAYGMNSSKDMFSVQGANDEWKKTIPAFNGFPRAV